MKLSAGRVALFLGLLVLLFVGWFAYQLFGPSPAIVVSKETTWLTEPLADDGLPDYAKWYLDQQREGVTPENNAAIPFLEAMWPANLSPQHYRLVCGEIGMPVPVEDGILEAWYDTEWTDSVHRALTLILLARRGITPPEPITTAEEFEEWKRNWQPDDDGDESGEFDEFHGFVGDDHPFDIAFEDAYTLIEEALDVPWTAEQLPPLAEWVARYERHFDLLHEAARRPKYYCPSPSLLEDPNASFVFMLLSDVQALRSATRALNTRAMFFAGSGEFAAAWNDIRAMYLLADHTPAGTLVGQLVRIACWGVSDEACLQLFNSPALPADVARAMHEFFQSRPLTRDMHDSIDGVERLSAVTSILEMARLRKSADASLDDFGMGGNGLDVLARSAIDWNTVLEKMNALYDEIAEAMRIKDFAERQQALDQLEARLAGIAPQPGAIAGGLVSRNARSNLMADVFAALFLPAVSAATQAEDRANAKLILMKTAAALAVYRAENGEYPESLDALVPELLATIPTDNYSGAPLSYTKTENGYLLVNIGPNGVDNGGSHEMYGAYKGYQLEDAERDATIAELLGEPLQSGEDAEEGDEDDLFGDDIYGLEESQLTDDIPTDADDWSIRLPLVPANWSMLERDK